MIDKTLIKQRVIRLRAQMHHLGLDALIVNRGDEYLSEYLPPNKERLSFISGFTGSAGLVVILKETEIVNIKNELVAIEKDDGFISLQNAAAIFVDGRYTLQAKNQVPNDLYDVFLSSKVSVNEWLSTILPEGAIVGIDSKCVSYDRFISLKSDLSIGKISVISTSNNMVDEIWHDNIKAEISQVEIFEDKYNGCPSLEKRKQIAKTLRDKGVDATLISKSESVNWLLNVRGRDIPNLPVVNSFVVLYSSERIEWYVDSRKIPSNMLSDLQHHIGNIDYYPEEKLSDLPRRLGKDKSQIYIDSKNTNAWIVNNLKEAGVELVFGPDLCEMPKACKNKIEIEGMRKCHRRDAVAMCRFLAWLDHLTEPLFIKEKDSENQKSKEQLSAKGSEKDFTSLYAQPNSPALELLKNYDEASLSNQLLKFRKEQEGFIEPSFDTISALGPNASLIHYNHLNLGSPRVLGQDSLYLVDSGGHYYDGTTDITRTVMVGPNVTNEMKERFTQVLKGLIAMHRIRFPKNTYGVTLDVLARAPLWRVGLNYEHGTGHGVGHCLNVHEGPQAISQHGGSAPLMEGMVTSIEPGFYKDEEYGIRLENLTVVEQARANLSSGNMYYFVPITFVPFDTRLIKKELMTENEKIWLNEYHFKVREIVKDHLSDFEISWLLKATAAI